MRKTTKVIIAIGTAAAIIAGVSACNQRSPEQKADYLVERVTKKLELNSHQVTQLEDLKHAVLTVHSDMKQQHELMHQQFTDLLKQPQIEEKMLLELLDSHMQHMRDQTPKVINAAASFYNQLTPTQQAELRAAAAKHQDFNHH